MMYKNIELDYLTLCLDRLTRFKFTYDKYYRVFYDIFNKYYLGDKRNVNLEDVISIVCDIFNSSVSNFSDFNKNDDFLNNLLINDERRCFYQTKESEKFLSSKLNIKGLVDAIGSVENLPLNLRWLLEINKNNKTPLDILRKKLSVKFPIEKVVLSEGATEEILLCEFSRGYGFDFNKEGIELVGAGGKNQVARKYYQMIEEIKLPIFILLDKDAVETRDLILPKLRKSDKIYLIKSGEFEDIIPLNVVIGSVNLSFKSNYHIKETDFLKDYSMVKNLKEIYRINGFGNFNKANFAKCVKEYLNYNYEITDEMSSIIESIKSL